MKTAKNSLIKSVLGTLAIACCLNGCGGGASSSTEGELTGTEPAPPTAPAADRAVGVFSFDPAGDPCAAFTPEQVAAAFGVEASEVTEEAGEAADFATGSRDCIWRAAPSGGLVRDAILYVRDRPERLQSEEPITFLIDGYLNNGETIGSMEFTHQRASFSGVEGILSEVHGGRYSRAQIFTFPNGQEQLLRLTVTVTMEEDVELPDPAPETFEQLAAALRKG